MWVGNGGPEVIATEGDLGTFRQSCEYAGVGRSQLVFPDTDDLTEGVGRTRLYIAVRRTFLLDYMTIG